MPTLDGAVDEACSYPLSTAVAHVSDQKREFCHLLRLNMKSDAASRKIPDQSLAEAFL